MIKASIEADFIVAIVQTNNRTEVELRRLNQDKANFAGSDLYKIPIEPFGSKAVQVKVLRDYDGTYNVLILRREEDSIDAYTIDKKGTLLFRNQHKFVEYNQATLK